MSEVRVPRPHSPGSRGSLLPRIGRAWRALDSDSRLAAGSSLALFVTMFLPWYQQNLVTSGSRSRLESQNLSAFGVFSFIEAAILLVAVAVLVLLFARAERRAFHLPGGDGTIVTAAGGWCVLLLIWRLFDKPDISGSAAAGNVGVQWGIFFALAAAGLLLYAGLRLRSAARPEPPLLIEGRLARRATPAERPAPGTEVTRVLPPEGPANEAATEPIRPDRATDEAPTQRTRPDRAPDQAPTHRTTTDAAATNRSADDAPTERLPADDAPTRRLGDD